MSGRVFNISKGQGGFECRVSSQAFEQNMADICRVVPDAPAMNMAAVPTIAAAPAPEIG